MWQNRHLQSPPASHCAQKFVTASSSPERHVQKVPAAPFTRTVELPDRGQNPPQGSPKARRWLLNALGPCLRPGIRHGADGVLESREGSLLGVTAMIGCCMAALCPAAAGSLVPAQVRVITPSEQRSMAEPAETGGCLSRKLHEVSFCLVVNVTLQYERPERGLYRLRHVMAAIGLGPRVWPHSVLYCFNTCQYSRLFSLSTYRTPDTHSSRLQYCSFWKPLPRRKISPAAQTVQADSRSRHTHRQENVPKCRQTSKMLLAGLGYMLCLCVCV